MKKLIQGRISTTNITLFVSLLVLSACDPNSLPAILNGATPTPSPSPTSTPIPAPTSTPTPTPTATPIPSPTPDKTTSLSVVIRKATGFDSSELAKLEKARSALQVVVNSLQFKQKILNFTYAGENEFVQNDGKTNLEIYNEIMAGAEQYPRPTTANHAMDFYVELYYEASSVIGYTDPSTSTIYMNSYYFDDADPSEIAGNMMHEWLHKVGFDHDYNSTTRRPYSVPYAIGYIAEDLVADYL